MRRKPPLRSGIERGPERDHPKHLRWIRGLACIVPGCPNRDIVAAHVRLGLPAGSSRGGTGLKPGDEWTVPMCNHHHAGIQHPKGEKTFAETYAIDLVRLAQRYAAASPHLPRERVKPIATRQE